MKRKLIGIIISLSLLLPIVPASIVSAADDDIIRVKLSMGTPSSVRVFLDGNYSVSGAALERQMYTVKLESGKLNLYLGSSKIAGGSSIYITQHKATSGQNNFMWLHNDLYNRYLRYLGDMNFTISSGAIKVVNHIYLEDYLYGVLPYEMNDSFPLEALKSQAVAARNYAAKRIGGSGSHDITDASAYDQVYRGWSASYKNCIAAVDGTAGQLLMSGSRVIDAYYSASNGGRTELPYHRWGGGYEWTYYQITDDPFDTRNPSSLYETITFPIAIDSSHPVTTKDNVSGTPSAAKAIAYIKYEILQSGQLTSRGVDSASGFELAGVTGLLAHTPEITYNSSGNVAQDHSRMPNTGVNNCLDLISATGDFTVKVGAETVAVTDITLDLRYLDGGKKSTNDQYEAFVGSSLGVFTVEPVKTGETVTGFSISQKRFGHGCGLSQRGAQQRAAEGQKYADILGFYYPGATLTPPESARPSLTESVSPNYYNATVKENVNVRSGPGTSYSILAGSQIPAGMRVEITKPLYTSNWHQINYGGTLAYVDKDYITIDKDFSSTPYIRMNGMLYIPDGVTPSALLSNVTHAEGEPALYDPLGAEYGAPYVGTGAKLKVESGGAVLEELGVVVLGDANGDGSITISDYTLARLDILGLKALAGAQRDGADVNRDGKVSISDYTLMRLDILGLKSIH